MLGEISIDGGLQVGDRAKDAAADALPRHLGEEVFDGVEPGGRGRREMEGPARMARQPTQRFGMLGVVVEHGVDRLAGRDFTLDGIEKADEFAVAVALPGLIGNPGWVRSSAWIWLFSSIDSTTVWAGGST